MLTFLLIYIISLIICVVSASLIYDDYQADRRLTIQIIGAIPIVNVIFALLVICVCFAMIFLD